MRIDLSAAHALAATQGGLIFASQLTDVGLHVGQARDLCRRGTWRRVCRGGYDTLPELTDDGSDRFARQAAAHARLVRAAAANLPADVVLVAESAARLHGFAGLPPWDGRVYFASQRSIGGPAKGAVVVQQWVLADDEITEVDGIRVASHHCIVADLVLRLRRDHAVSILDHVLNVGVIQRDELPHLEARCAGRPGVVAAREYLRLADGRAQSPLESRVRLRCIDGGVPPDELQWAVRDADGHTLGYGDMAWFRRRRRPLIGEADGEDVHGAPEALYADRVRANFFVVAGVDIVRFTWRDTYPAERIPSLVWSALAA